MYFDALTLAAVAAELRNVIDGRIQRVTIPSRLSIALEIYADHRRHHLLISAHPRFARVHLSAGKPSRGVAVDTPMLLLLRKYVVGGRITAIEQPDLERVLLISIAKRPPKRNFHADTPDDAAPDDDLLDEEPEDDDAELLHTELAVEIMDQRSNIVLVGDNNIILECVRHVTPDMSRRPLMPREPYELPPAQQKRDPRQATAAGIEALFDDAAAPVELARALVGAYRGLAPLAAREIAFRSTGRADTRLAPDLPWEAIAAATRAIWQAPPQPSLAVADGRPLAFAPYALTHVPGWAPHPTMSGALDQFYAAHERLTSHQQRKEALHAQLLEQRERLARQQRSLSTELERARDIDRLRWEGEMIFAFMHEIARGQQTLEVEGRTITLDPLRTPVECAQERFRAYEKARSAIAGLPERLAAVDLRIAGVDETIALLAIAEGYEEIETIAQEAIEEGFIPADGRRKQRGRGGVRPQSPLRLVSTDGVTIYVGRSAGQNQQVTFRLASSDDLWLHARGAPGAHVIVKSGGRPVPEQTLQEAAGLAAYFSHGRHEAAVDVDIARRSQVRRIRGGPQGLVSYHAEQSIRAAPRPPW